MRLKEVDMKEMVELTLEENGCNISELFKEKVIYQNAEDDSDWTFYNKDGKELNTPPKVTGYKDFYNSKKNEPCCKDDHLEWDHINNNYYCRTCGEEHDTYKFDSDEEKAELKKKKSEQDLARVSRKTMKKFLRNTDDFIFNDEEYHWDSATGSIYRYSANDHAYYHCYKLISNTIDELVDDFRRGRIDDSSISAKNSDEFDSERELEIDQLLEDE